MTIAERLLARLRQEGADLPEGARLVRTYVSRADRANGAWTWWALDSSGFPLLVGSWERMADLLKAQELSIEANEWGETCVVQGRVAPPG
jgi:hypothetical protein